MSEWRDIATAPKDGSRVLLMLRDDDVIPEHAKQFRGVPFVGRNMGGGMEWCFAAPVGQGGFPDSWMVGWQPLPAPPAEPQP